MTDHSTPAPGASLEQGPPHGVCGACGAMKPLDELYGIPGEYRCEGCARGVRERMAVRQRRTLPQRVPYVTAGALAISGLLFLLSAFVWRGGPANPETPAWFVGLYHSADVWRGEWWRHISTIFLHGDVMHILFNGVSIWSIGRLVEVVWGPVVALIVLLLTGVAGSAAGFATNAPAGAVGLSGALFGMCGFMWALRKHHPIAGAVMSQRMRNWILMLLVVGVVLTQTGAMPISNAGHVGGLLAGFALGFAWRIKPQWAGVFAVAAGVVALVVLVQVRGFGSVKLRNGESMSREALREQYVNLRDGS